MMRPRPIVRTRSMLGWRWCNSQSVVGTERISAISCLPVLKNINAKANVEFGGVDRDEGVVGLDADRKVERGDAVGVAGDGNEGAESEHRAADGEGEGVFGDACGGSGLFAGDVVFTESY